MNIVKPTIQNLQQHKIGTCPHGLPAGACPICNGMGGGGGGAAKKADRPAGEMTWDQCYAVWQKMLQAKDLAAQKKHDAMQAQMQAPVNFSAKIENAALKIAGLADKLANFVQNAKQTPTIMTKTLALAAKIAIPVLNVLQNVANLAQKAVNFVQQKLADISDKLNAIFGELKNSIEKKISDKLKDFKKRFKSIFGIDEPDVMDDEEKQVEEAKRLFEFKTVLHNIAEKVIKKEENNDW